MRVGIIQSSYIPWRGYFDFIDQVDLFVFHDDLQFTKGDWRNRNKVKTPKGLCWLTVPVSYQHTNQLICDTMIDYSQPWARKHVQQIQAHYAGAPFYRQFADEFAAILAQRFRTISELNVALCCWVMDKLDIFTPIRMSSELAPVGRKTERLIDILNKVGADTYLSGPTAKGYLDEDLLRAHGIRLEYKSYDCPPYPQLWGGFEGAVTVLDLLFNTGPRAQRYMHSLTPNELARRMADPWNYYPEMHNLIPHEVIRQTCQAACQT